MEIPLQLALKFPIGSFANLVFRFGAYVDIGLWGTVKYTPDGGDEEKFDVYGNRIGGGAIYGFGVEFGRFMVGDVGHTGEVPNERSDGAGYTSFGFEIDYKFW